MLVVLGLGLRLRLRLRLGLGLWMGTRSHPQLPNHQSLPTSQTHYGKDEPSSVKAIKNLYRELNIEEIYAEQERESFERISKLIKNSTSEVPSVVYEHILNKVP